MADSIPLIPLKGIHEDFCFKVEDFPMNQNLREALQKSPLAAMYQDKALPVYPLFLSLDLEESAILECIEPDTKSKAAAEKVILTDGFSEKKIVYLGVKTCITVEGLGQKLVNMLASKNHELGLTREEANPRLMVEWARDNAKLTLENLTMKKYFPQCYIERSMDMRLAESLENPLKAVVITGEAGGKKLYAVQVYRISYSGSAGRGR